MNNRLVAPHYFDQSQTLIKLASDSANDCFVANVRCAKSAGSQTAEVIAERDEDNGLAHARGLHSAGHTAGAPAVNANIGLDDFRVEVSRETKKSNQ